MQMTEHRTTRPDETFLSFMMSSMYTFASGTEIERALVGNGAKEQNIT
jgi:hypothetical protein